MNGDSFKVDLSIIDEWESGNDKYRLVNLGAGPAQLQILDGGNWREESVCYRWSTLTHRIDQLRNSQEYKEENSNSADSQIDDLAKFIMAEADGEPSKDEGAVECAMRLIRESLPSGKQQTQSKICPVTKEQCDRAKVKVVCESAYGTCEHQDKLQAGA